MTGAGDDTQPAMTYPRKEQYQQWKKEAEDADESVSRWMANMIEAGRKKFDARVEPDETNQELREHRNDLKQELDRSRERIEQLENKLHRTERAAVLEHIENNPGASYGEIIQKIGDTVPERVTHHLDDLLGQDVRKEGDYYYPAGDDL